MKEVVRKPFFVLRFRLVEGPVCVCLAFPTFLRFFVELNITKVQITSTSAHCENETQYLHIIAVALMDLKHIQHA